LLRKSWIVFIQALLLSFESIVVEFLTEMPGISSLVVGGISIPIAGIILVLARAFFKRENHCFQIMEIIV